MGFDAADVDREWIFKKFDASGDGNLPPSNLEESLKTLGSVTIELVKKMINQIDTDGMATYPTNNLMILPKTAGV